MRAPDARAGTPRRVFLDSLGCRLNDAELQSWARAFRGAGHRIVGHPIDADVVVVNTCAVTGEAVRKSRQLIRRRHRENPRARLVLSGCFAELDRDRAAALEGVDLVVGNREKDRLATIVLDTLMPGVMPAPAREPHATPYPRAARTRAFVKVQDGCRHRCTFCIVTVARGEERSRTLDDVVGEISDLEAAGVQEIVLTGVHLGGYGSDVGVDLRTLVEAVLSRTRVPRVRLSSLEPWDLPDGFFDLWRDPRLMPHLHLPIQSGADTVLRRMGRRCDVATFRALADTARAAIDGVTLTTDVIVGFPGETDAEWRETMRTIESIGFGHLHVFTYSAREGTGAARLANQVTTATKRARSAEIRELAARMKADHLSRHVGTSRPVLWETRVDDGASPRVDIGIDVAAGASDTTVRWSGYTDNYLRVCTRVHESRSLANLTVDTRLVSHDGETLTGDVTVASLLAVATPSGG